MELLLHYIDDEMTYQKYVGSVLQNTKIFYAGVDYTFIVKTFSNLAAYEQGVDPKIEQPHVVLIDIFLGESGSGLSVAHYANRNFPNATKVVFSGLDNVENIAQFMQAGVDNFVSKNLHMQEFPQIIIQSFIQKSLQSEEVHTKAKILSHHAGRTMQNIAQRVGRIIRSAVQAVHVCGESGTGKEIVADLFEHNVAKNIPFIRVNSAALSPQLLESELFGYKKGAFTGAMNDRIGYLEAASGGWLFLDEVALLSLQAQAALLRAIENQQIVRIGETTTRSIDVKIISATNENLAELVRGGKFRLDLWQRLREIEIYLPPLRDRMDEIGEIASLLVEKMSGGPYTIALMTLKVLQRYRWPHGNIRELRNCLRAMTEFHFNRVLDPSSVPKHIYQEIANEDEKKVEVKLELENIDWTNFSYDKMEQNLFLQVLHKAIEVHPNHSLRKLSLITGIARPTLSRRLANLYQLGLLDEKLAKFNFKEDLQ